MTLNLTQQQKESMEAYYSQWPTTKPDEKFVMAAYAILARHGESTSYANIAGYIQESRGNLSMTRFTVPYIAACLYRGSRG